MFERRKSLNRIKLMILKIALVSLISMLIIFGSNSIFRAPIIADDLRVLTEGLADLSQAENLFDVLQVAVQNIKDSTGFHHIMPFAGLIGFLEVSLVFVFSHFIPDPLFLYSVLRSSWHLFAIGSMSIFLSGFISQKSSSKFHNFITLYLIAGIGFISFTQIHSAWKEAPIASYGLHGSGIVAMGFLFLHGIHINSKDAATKFPRVFWVTILGLVGTLTYEMFVAPLVAAVVLYFYLRSKSERSGKSILKDSRFYSMSIPVAVFFSANFIRLLFPEKNYYDGTRVGDLSQVIPNFISGIYGSLPLTFLGTAVGQVGIQSISLEKILFYLISVGFLMVVLIFAPGAEGFSGKKILLQKRNFLNSLLILLWLISTLSFMFSAKYQRELGVSIGTVYMFYAIGNLAVIGIVSLWVVRKNLLTQIAIILSISVIGIFTNTYNYALVDKMKANTTIVSYSKMYASVHDESLTNPKRCELLTNLRASNLPEYYKSSLIQNFQIYYFNEFGEPFCLWRSYNS